MIISEYIISYLTQADTVNPTYPSHLYTNIVREEAAEDGLEKVNELEMIANNDRRIVEENEDLKRQLVFLRQQLEEKDRQIKYLENQVACGIKTTSAVVPIIRQNSASQVLQTFIDVQDKIVLVTKGYKMIE